MKRTLLLPALLAIFCCNGLYAQWQPSQVPYPVINQPGARLTQIVDTLAAHSNPDDTAEGGVQDDLNSFNIIWRARVNLNDSSGQNMFQQYVTELGHAVYARATSSLGCGGGGFTGAWSPGPDNLGTQTSGYVNAVWAGSGADSNLLLAGSAYSWPGLGLSDGGLFGSGLFKSTDQGGHWNNITDNAPVSGIVSVWKIAVNPLNTSTIFLGTGATSLLESFDGGNNWQEEIIRPWANSVNNIVFTPDSTRLYAIIGDSVYTRSNIGTGNPWINITPNETEVNYNEIVFLPGNQNTLFLSGSSTHTGIWESTTPVPTISDWTKITNGFTDVVDGDYVSDTGWWIMSVSVPDDDTLFFAAMDYATHNASLYKYNLTGTPNVITKIYDNLPHGPLPRAGVFGLIVSPAGTSNNGNRRNIYYGSDIPFHSYDGGGSFVQIGQYVGVPTHGDIRGMYLAQSSNTLRGSGDRLFLATDGGVSERRVGVDDSVAGVLSTIDVSGVGLDVGTYYSFVTSEKGGIAAGGMMHDGLTTYEPDKIPKWQSDLTGDTYYAAIDNTQPTAYSFAGYTTSGAPIPMFETEPASGRLLAGVNSSIPQPEEGSFVGNHIETDNFGTIYAAFNSLMVKRTTDPNFVLTQDYLTPWGFPTPFTTTAVGISITLNPNDTTFEGYVLYNNNQIYYRNFGNPTYVTAVATNPVPMITDYPINEVVTDPNNTARVWVCQGGINSSSWYRVQYSPDYGTHWIDVSNGLPTIAATCLVYDDAANCLYASTDAGMYKCDFSSFDASANTINSDGNVQNSSVMWTCFNTGLVAGQNFPNVPVTDLRINHCEGKLYAATHCRSVWSTDINPPGTQVNTTVTISSDQTWTGGSGNQYMNGSIDVLPGVTFTIGPDDTVHMPKGGAITVEPGAHLIVNSAELTNDCATFWQGIIVKGTSDPQSSGDQGLAILSGNSTIKNAMVGIRNDGTGGIIKCGLVNFTDNVNSVTFTAYLQKCRQTATNRVLNET